MTTQHYTLARVIFHLIENTYELKETFENIQRGQQEHGGYSYLETYTHTCARLPLPLAAAPVPQGAIGAPPRGPERNSVVFS